MPQRTARLLESYKGSHSLMARYFGPTRTVRTRRLSEGVFMRNLFLHSAAVLLGVLALSALGAGQAKFRTTRKRTPRDLREYDGPAPEVLRSRRCPTGLPGPYAI